MTDTENTNASATGAAAEQERIDGQFLVDEYRGYRRAGALIVIAGMLALFVAAGLGGTNPTIPPDFSKLGIHLLLGDGRNQWDTSVWDTHLSYATQVTGRNGYVVQLIRENDRDVEKWQLFMDSAATYNLTPIIRLATTWDDENENWRAPTPDADGGYTQWAQEWADFINKLDFPTARKHIIVLNEVNNGEEWSGQPDAAAYARLLRDAGTVFHENIEGVQVLNAGLDLHLPHTGEAPFPGRDEHMIHADAYLEAMHAAVPDAFAQIDIWNSHAYPLDSFSAPPWEQEFRFDVTSPNVPEPDTPPDGIFNRGINGYEWELWKLSQLGIAEKPVMITEIGWRHAESTASDTEDTPPDGITYPPAERAAIYLDMALRGNPDGRYPDFPAEGWQPLLRDPRVIGVIPFALNGIPQEWGHSNWLMMNDDGSVEGTYALFDTVSDYTLR